MYGTNPAERPDGRGNYTTAEIDKMRENAGYPGDKPTDPGNVFYACVGIIIGIFGVAAVRGTSSFFVIGILMLIAAAGFLAPAFMATFNWWLYRPANKKLGQNPRYRRI